MAGAHHHRPRILTRFSPEDDGLVARYLYPKAASRTVPDYVGRVVKDCDLYGREQQPGEIWNTLVGRESPADDVTEVFFFAKVRKTLETDGSTSISRRIGGGAGAWYGEDLGVEFVVVVVEEEEGMGKKENRIAAVKKRFSYRNEGSSEHLCWVLHEYSLPSVDTDFVLCRLRKNQVALHPAVRFYPADNELVSRYLHPKTTAKYLPEYVNLYVKECDLYGLEEPWEIWARHGGEALIEGVEDLYFFTKLKKKDTNGSRINRRVGTSSEGTWHGEDFGSEFDVEVVDEDGNEKVVTAMKKRYSYRNQGSSQSRCWILHEYSLPKENTDFVLCRLRRNPVNGTENGRGKRLKKRKSSSETEDDSVHKVDSPTGSKNDTKKSKEESNEKTSAENHASEGPRPEFLLPDLNIRPSKKVRGEVDEDEDEATSTTSKVADVKGVESSTLVGSTTPQWTEKMKEKPDAGTTFSFCVKAESGSGDVQKASCNTVLKLSPMFPLGSCPSTD